MDGDFEIGTPGLEDLDELVILWGELVRSQRGYGTRLQVSENASNARSWIAARMTVDGVRIARVSESIVGFVSFEPMHDQFDRVGGDGVIHNLYVRPSVRGRGIGSALMEHAEAILRARGADRVRLQVLSDNLTAASFYRARGYRPYRAVYRKRLEETDTHNASGSKE